MNNGKILIVEDDFDISNMLRIFFSGQGYQVDVAARGNDALEQCRKSLPDLVVLDIMLPDMDGYAVCKSMRTTTRTSHIPIIFLTQKDERSDKIAGLELGADDYITKPFDIEELKLRVGTAIRTHQRLNMTDPRTGLPSARLIEDQLRSIMRETNWTLLLVGVDHLNPFTDAYGFVAGDEVMRFTAMLLNEVVDGMGTLDDFIGHASNETLVLITVSDDVAAIEGALREKFDEGILAHYNFMDREQGGISMPDGSLAPLMRLSIGTVSGKTQRFSDIREITEMAAEYRRMDQGK
ncbi:MAG: response regulator [Ardenticatenaceae bacterium]|nr:response regulator [Ardenticatenaceae bacterium]MCB9445001.1 response regulator [Ardenticatenaceae bacterium]